MGQQIITGILLVIIGFFIMRGANAMLKAFGRVGMFEKFLRTEGGTRLFYQLVGLLLIAVGFMYATGIFQRLVGSLFRPFFRFV